MEGVSDNTLKQLEQLLKNRKKYQVRRFKTQRHLDVDNATIGDLANVLATLLSDKNKELG